MKYSCGFKNENPIMSYLQFVLPSMRAVKAAPEVPIDSYLFRKFIHVPSKWMENQRIYGFGHQYETRNHAEGFKYIKQRFIKLG